MSQRIGNYCAFYVADTLPHPVPEWMYAKPDFQSYQLLRTWKGKDPSFPFVDSHAATYNVRDDSDWEKTLKPRLRQRLRASRNIILFLSESTKSSRALREEVDYGINNQGLPVIVVYPEFETAASLRTGRGFSARVTGLWDKLPIFRKSMNLVPVLHVPLKKNLVQRALTLPEFRLNTKGQPGNKYFTS